MAARPVDQFSPDYFKPREYVGGSGHNVHVQIVIERHGEPQKDPVTGKSLDELTEKGISDERGKGARLEVPAGGIKGYGSPKKRAQQSIDLQLEGILDAGEGATIINKRLEDVATGPLGLDPTKVYRDKDSSLTPFIIREKRELDALPVDPAFFRAMAFENPEELDELKLIKRSYDDLCQYYLDHTDPTGKTPSPEEAAAMVAYRVGVELGMVSRLKDFSDVLLKNLTHGPFIDAFLQQVIIREVDGQKVSGFQNVEEVGGALKPMEGYTIDAHTDADGTLSFKLILREQEYEVDEKRLTELALKGKEFLQSK